MNFTVSLSKKLVLKAELGQRFDDLKNFANMTKPTPKDVEKQAIEYRHLAYAPVFELMRVARPLATNATSYAGWFQVTNLSFHHASTHANAPNFEGGSYPSVEFSAKLGVVGASGAVGELATAKMAIGWSNDLGVTWNHIPASIRSFGSGCGSIFPFYDNRTQPHYMTGLAGYFPICSPTDRMVPLEGTFGGSSFMSLKDPTTITNYCVMLNRQVDTTVFYGWGWAELNAREIGF